jgi:hypothetical protein
MITSVMFAGEYTLWSSLFYISKSCPTTRHEVAWVERRYSSYSFSTSALDGGEWSASLPGRPLAPGKGPPVPVGQEAGWAPELVWTQRLEEKSFSPLPGIEHPSPGRPARSQTLYWLSYQAHILYFYILLFSVSQIQISSSVLCSRPPQFLSLLIKKLKKWKLCSDVTVATVAESSCRVALQIARLYNYVLPSLLFPLCSSVQLTTASSVNVFKIMSLNEDAKVNHTSHLRGGDVEVPSLRNSSVRVCCYYMRNSSFQVKNTCAMSLCWWW